MTLPNDSLPRQSTPRHIRKRLRWMLFSSLGAGYFVFARYSAAHSLPVLCPFRLLTGLRCPLCGLTTSTAHLLRGDVRRALRAHPLGPVIVIGALIWYGRTTGELLQEWAVSPLAAHQKGNAYDGYQKR